jgi:flagellar motor switch protein FliG
MGVYTRFKKDPEGFRKLVELLESTPASRRSRMIEVGLEEDPEFTHKALEHMLTMRDLIALPDLELAELVASVPLVRTLAYALKPLDTQVRQRFLRNAKPPIAFELRELLELEPSPSEIGGAQLKLVETARGLERRGLIQAKKISG